MTNPKRNGFKQLRRPLAPPAPARPPPRLLPRSGKRSNYATGPSLWSQSISPPAPSNEPEEEDGGLNVPSNTPSLASDDQDTVNLVPQNTPWTKHGSSSYAHYQDDVHGTVDPPGRCCVPESHRCKHGEIGAVPSNLLVKPYKARGPDGFPLRAPLRPLEVFLRADDDHFRYHKSPEFTLEDFLLHHSPQCGCLQHTGLNTAMFSKQSYEKITTMFATLLEKPAQDKVNTVEFEGLDFPEIQQRVPKHQILLEMASMIREEMQSMVSDEPMEHVPGMEDRVGGRAPSPASSGPRKLLPPIPLRGTGLSEKENVFNLPPSNYFQGSVRSREPFEESDSEETITPSELAVLYCLVNGGSALSLKAYFIGSLPEVNPLNTTITYLNLSFNDFRVISFANLEILKMRNNPLNELPQDIYKLKKLKTLVLSFCLISTLPINLFQLQLDYLDLSYNKLSFLPNEVKQFRMLRSLNLEGNQLAALPCSALKLTNLRSLRVYNNVMHPLLWKENSQNNPQRLTDITLLICKQEAMECEVAASGDQQLQMALDSYTVCECCHGPLYGPGLRIIRPRRRAFGVCNLPFFFTACSPQCRDFFMQNVETVSEIVYGDHG